jgi:hypothetical protein
VVLFQAEDDNTARVQAKALVEDPNDAFLKNLVPVKNPAWADILDGRLYDSMEDVTADLKNLADDLEFGSVDLLFSGGHVALFEVMRHNSGGCTHILAIINPDGIG